MIAIYQQCALVGIDILLNIWKVFGRDTVWDKCVEGTRNDEQTSDGGVLRTGVFR